MESDFAESINLGSDEMVSMNELANICLDVAGRKLPLSHVPGPEGVRGRNSENTLIKQVLGWAPSVKIKDGLALTQVWLKDQIEKEKAKGVDVAAMASSKVVQQSTESLDKL
jgi:GDP-D-mannose 3',5'-epimerase